MPNVYVAEKAQLNTQNDLLNDYNDNLSAIESELSDIATLAQSKQIKTVTPSATQQIVEADVGYSSLASVIVDPAPSPTLQSKTVTPTASQQTIQPDGGYDGLSLVTVLAALLGLDPNTLSNIELGVDSGGFYYTDEAGGGTAVCVGMDSQGLYVTDGGN